MKRELTAIPNGYEVAENIFKMFFSIIAVSVSLVFIVALYQELDQEGGLPSLPLPHTKWVNLYFAGEWPEGETQTCSMSNARSRHIGEMLSVDCFMSDQEPQLHQIKVTFYGDLSEADWMCTRYGDDLRCKLP